ncbi:hypothetical protein [Pseudonocardia parietis]|uniref:Uncharacterized protein n=1 Tax=Pseudonocardia parietis TaxID=570936 RepID=A0ABS4VP95_9PSEU|nr:hypothetical protein [Pseudonocardia parietis]MBP2365743.1 hypothetical protein [Pseudonocardia parietis]
MSAPVVRIPGPRRPVDLTAPFAGPGHRIGVPAPRVTPGDRHRDGGYRAPEHRPVHGPPRAGSAPGRHRGAPQPFPSAARTFTVLARAGSLTSLAAMVVLAAAVAGLADGNPPTGAAADVAVSSLDR